MKEVQLKRGAMPAAAVPDAPQVKPAPLGQPLPMRTFRSLQPLQALPPLGQAAQAPAVQRETALPPPAQTPVAASAPASGSTAAQAVVRPDTPCVAVCSTTFDEICRGCGRTYLEVAHWVSMTDEAKELVWQRITAQGYPRRNP